MIHCFNFCGKCFKIFPLGFMEIVLIFQDDEDLTQDRDFLQQVLENLPGVDPNSEAIQSAMSSLTKGDKSDKDKDSDKKS